MRARTCLWMGLAAVAVISVCCIEVLIGAALASRDTAGPQVPIGTEAFSPTELSTAATYHAAFCTAGR